MQPLIKLFVSALALFAFSNCQAQIANSKTETVKIYGNCGMCEKTIEKAAFQKGVAKADWDQDSNMAEITFDSLATTADAILQRIAAAGYASDRFPADEAAYHSLAGCCQYDRPVKTKTADAAIPATGSEPLVAVPAEKMIKKQATAQVVTPDPSPLSGVYSAYFALKNALVASDGQAAAKQAKLLSSALTTVQTDGLNADQQEVWKQLQSKLNADAEAMLGLTKVDRQREHFARLSNHMFTLMKAISPARPVYYAHCPMYGDGKTGNWLSTEAAIKNPYFGQQMLSCGSVTETLQ